MHDLLVVVATLVSLGFLLWISCTCFDIMDAYDTAKRIKEIDLYLDATHTVNDPSLVVIIMAELYSRMSMTGEYQIKPYQNVAIKIIADHIVTLTICQVKNQLDMLNVIVDRLNRADGFNARVNLTTNNRVELIVKHVSCDQLMYVKFYSINTLF